MVEFGFEENEGSVVCEGCGTEIPAFLDGCPYCAGAAGDDDATLPCPSCGADIHELSQQCPVCGAWVKMGAGAVRSRLGWAVAVVVILLLVVLLVTGAF